MATRMIRVSEETLRALRRKKQYNRLDSYDAVISKLLKKDD